jgi:hypothetical protein
MDAKHYVINRRLTADEDRLLVVAKCLYKLLEQQDGEEWQDLRYLLNEAFGFEL